MQILRARDKRRLWSRRAAGISFSPTVDSNLERARSTGEHLVNPESNSGIRSSHYCPFTRRWLSRFPNRESLERIHDTASFTILPPSQYCLIHSLAYFTILLNSQYCLIHNIAKRLSQQSPTAGIGSLGTHVAQSLFRVKRVMGVENHSMIGRMLGVTPSDE